MKRLLPAVLIAALAVQFATLADAKGPLRVFVLTGQSNMEGKGKIQHLEELASDSATAAEYKHLRKGDGWVERDDVFIKYWDRKGKLTVGYATPKDRIGPELLPSVDQVYLGGEAEQVPHRREGRVTSTHHCNLRCLNLFHHLTSSNSIHTKSAHPHKRGWVLSISHRKLDQLPKKANNLHCLGKAVEPDRLYDVSIHA